MSQVNTLLNQRLNKSQQSSKMAAMAKRSAEGQLTSFSGVFSVAELSAKEKEGIETILNEFAKKNEDISEDLENLISITSEVKAINNQAAILHGERIKKAHTILTRYRDGAFTAWLIAVYGNRQTPYNLMQYYEFYEAMPKALRPQIEAMPRQAVYTLASREGALDKKQAIVENYKGETKFELLNLIREVFPLKDQDKRKINPAETTFNTLIRLSYALKRRKLHLTKTQKSSLLDLIGEIQEIISKS